MRFIAELFGEFDLRSAAHIDQQRADVCSDREDPLNNRRCLRSECCRLIRGHNVQNDRDANDLCQKHSPEFSRLPTWLLWCHVFTFRELADTPPSRWDTARRKPRDCE